MITEILRLHNNDEVGKKKKEWAAIHQPTKPHIHTNICESFLGFVQLSLKSQISKEIAPRVLGKRKTRVNKSLNEIHNWL